MLYCAVFPRGVHGLENNQYGPAILCVEFVLQFLQQLNAFSQRLLRLPLLVRIKVERILRIDILEPKLRALSDAIRLRIPFCVLEKVFHRVPSLSIVTASIGGYLTDADGV